MLVVTLPEMATSPEVQTFSRLSDRLDIPNNLRIILRIKGFPRIRDDDALEETKSLIETEYDQAI